MASEGLELVPIVGEDGALAGILTERALARRYVRESQEASELDAPTRVSAIEEVLGGELVAGEDTDVSGRVWVIATPAWNSCGRPSVAGSHSSSGSSAISVTIRFATSLALQRCSRGFDSASCRTRDRRAVRSNGTSPAWKRSSARTPPKGR